jgi:hypothetical protein
VRRVSELVVILRRMLEGAQKGEQTVPESADSGRALALRPDVVATVLEDGAVLLDLETKYFYELNASAWAVTQIFETGATPEQAEAVIRSWDAPEGVGRSVLEALVVEGLVADAPATQTTPDVPRYEGAWSEPRVAKQPEPLQRVMVSAFDPSLPLAE